MAGEQHVVIVHAPLHGVTATLKQLRKARRLKNRMGQRASIVCYSECYRQRRFLRGLLSWKSFSGPYTRPDPRRRIASWDVVVMVRRRYRTIHRYAFKAADAALPLKIAPDRWIVGWVGMTPAGVLELIWEHPHAGIREANPKSKRVQEYAKQAVSFEACIHNPKDSNHRVAAGGDLNFPWVRPENAPVYAPQRIIARQKMHDSRHAGVDWLTVWGLEIVEVEEIPPEQNGQDHPWFVVTVRPRND